MNWNAKRQICVQLLQRHLTYDLKWDVRLVVPHLVSFGFGLALAAIRQLGLFVYMGVF